MKNLKTTFPLWAAMLCWAIMLCPSCKREAFSPQPQPGPKELIAQAKNHVDSAIRRLGASAITQKLGANIAWEQAVTDSANNVRVPISIDLARAMKGTKPIQGAISMDVFELFVQNQNGKMEASVIHFFHIADNYHSLVMALDGRPRAQPLARLNATGQKLMSTKKGTGRLMASPPFNITKAQVLQLLSDYTGKNITSFLIMQCPEPTLFNTENCACDYLWNVEPRGDFENYFIMVDGTDEIGEAWGGFIPYELEIDPVIVILSMYPARPMLGVTIPVLRYVKTATHLKQELISETKDTRILEYSWIFLTSDYGTWYFVSTERATYKKENGQWVWDSLIHVGIEKVGETPGWETNCSVQSATPTINAQRGSMELNYHYRATPVERDYIKPTTDFSTTQKSPIWLPSGPPGENGGALIDGGDGEDMTISIPYSGPKIDPKLENKCFDINQSATLTIYVQQGNEGTRDLVGTNQVGHVFIGIKQGGIERLYGFYPKSSSNTAMVAVGKSYESELRSNGGELYHVSISATISSKQLTAIINYANSPPSIYNVNSYACTDFGIAIGKLGGINLPSTKSSSLVFHGTSPGNLGEDIRTGSFPGTIKTTTKSKAAQKKGNCN